MYKKCIEISFEEVENVDLPMVCSNSYFT